MGEFFDGFVLLRAKDKRFKMGVDKMIFFERLYRDIYTTERPGEFSKTFDEKQGRRKRRREGKEWQNKRRKQSEVPFASNNGLLIQI